MTNFLLIIDKLHNLLLMFHAFLFLRIMKNIHVQKNCSHYYTFLLQRDIPLFASKIKIIFNEIADIDK